jgi:iron complex transport system substrate-binding protein
MDLETFYTTSKDADILIYNSTVDTELTSIDDLIKKSPLLEDFKAVKTGDVWCTNQNMFQQISGTADMIAEMYSVIHDDGDVGTRGDLVYLHKLS